ncbi:helix-turn-helix domain-containing protein [Variovorax sp. RKNM96]|uniref:helix-turn-helix domain-containing protein n=1 Tax=Variovorax sp. RKNM96 TaxID=2681552 RepID=UPI001980E4C1|nr:AraC family transcriptional regulator [Variovorax sp. RKNM96]QSI31639.1 helix-turn-helix domain-containing protein [Variovorax sp. RKNM96]
MKIAGPEDGPMRQRERPGAYTMEHLACYWRDADLAALQFTANRFVQREIRPHRHGGFMLSVSDTELRVRTGARVTVVPPNTLMRIAPQVWHSVQASAAPWREEALYCSLAVACCINPSEETVQALPAEGDASLAVFPQPSAAREFGECHRLLRDAAYGGNLEAGIAGRALLRSRLQQWIPVTAEPGLCSIGYAQAMQTARAVQAVDRGDERVHRLYGLIAAGFHEQLTLEELAQEVGWHPVHMHRRFKSAWGFTPHELLVGHRIEYARDLIAGGARVTYAAHAAGFSDQSHLHKTFMSTYAVVPGAYRRLSGLDALQPPAARNGIAG